MNYALANVISAFKAEEISDERRQVLQPLVDFIKSQRKASETVRLNFICTHNSRRSHLSQIWAQTMAYYFGIKDVYCYSGGTEATAMFPKVAETLKNQGFQILPVSTGENPVYMVKYAENEAAIICFSKAYDHAFNPKAGFGAVLTCNSADANCPVVFGAKQRIPVKYDDPKDFDGTALQDAKYVERSLEIGQEMWWVFGRV